jgi:hypothetical protein
LFPTNTAAAKRQQLGKRADAGKASGASDDRVISVRTASDGGAEQQKVVAEIYKQSASIPEVLKNATASIK